jgi:hypothetical protein
MEAFVRVAITAGMKYTVMSIASASAHLAIL